MICGVGHPDLGVPCLINAGHDGTHQIYYRDRLLEWSVGDIQATALPEVEPDKRDCTALKRPYFGTISTDNAPA